MKVLVFTNMFPFKAMPFYGSFVSDEVRALRAAGADVDVLFINGKASKFNYLASPWRFRAHLAATSYNVVHVHHSFCGYVAAMQRSVPVVWTFHEGEIAGGPQHAREERIGKRLAHSKSFKRRVARAMDAVIVVADYLKQPLGRMDAHTIPAGIDTKLFRPMDRSAARRELGLADDRKYVLFPSAPSRPGKRYDLAAAVVDKVPGAQLIALDDVPHDRVPLYMNASDVMLMTSAFEASPVTVREALACDVPVVSTNVGDVPVLARRVAGCVSVDGDNPEALASALSGVLEARKRADGALVREQYSLENTARKIVEVYHQVIDTREVQQR